MFAVTGAIHGVGHENAIDRENFGRPDSAESLENYKVVGLKRLFFGSAKSDLSAGEKLSLSHFLGHFRWSDQFIIELRGYTDGAESAESNRTLSAKRAEAIARFLSANGIPSQCIRTIGLGEIEGGQANNPEHRRVDLRIFMQPSDDISSRGSSTMGLVVAGR